MAGREQTRFCSIRERRISYERPQREAQRPHHRRLWSR
jgi:hypothetical protein